MLFFMIDNIQSPPHLHIPKNKTTTTYGQQCEVMKSPVETIGLYFKHYFHSQFIASMYCIFNCMYVLLLYKVCILYYLNRQVPRELNLGLRLSFRLLPPIKLQ